LEGFYVTNRIRQDKTVGSGGYHVLVYVSKDLKNGLAYDEKTWPPKPDFHPFAKVSSENASNSGVASNSSQTA